MPKNIPAIPPHTRMFGNQWFQNLPRLVRFNIMAT